MNSIVSEDIRNIINFIKKEAEVFSGRTILVSGGAGFLGNYLVASLLQLNKTILPIPCRVISMDNFITGSKKNNIADVEHDLNFQCIKYDVTKPIPLSLHADYIIHAAGLASPHYYRKFPLETIEVAVNGTRNFLEYAKEKKVQGMLYFSSSEIYGDPDPKFIPTPEEYFGNVHPIGPRACYDESKRLGETLCATYYQLFDLPIKIVRPFNVYGPGMKVNDYRVIPAFMGKAVQGKTLTVHDNGNQTRTFCYITDAIHGFFKVLLLGRKGEVYNIGRDTEEIDMNTLARLIIQLASTDATAQLINYPDSYPSGEPRRRCPDISKAKKELNFNPMIDLRTGLTRTMTVFKDLLHKNST